MLPLVVVKQSSLSSTSQHSFLTGLYSSDLQRRSWAARRPAAAAVTFAGAASCSSGPRLRPLKVAGAQAAAVGSAEVEAAKSTVKEGVWTLGEDIVSGKYRTTKEVIGICSWKTTRTGSNGSDYIAYDYFVKGGFPMVTIVEGQTFDTDGCRDWAKQ
jgi:hypothetical protein